MARTGLIVRAILIAGNLVGALALFWPFLLGRFISSTDVSRLLPFAWSAVLLVTVVLLVQTMLGRDRDIRQLAMLAALAALATAVRPLGAGVAGLEPIWAVILLGGRALGPQLGYLLGAISLFTSALFTGGVGPWLPYQMLVAAWIGALPGMWPQLRGRVEVLLMAGIGAVSGILIGALLNLWFWPLAIGLDPDIAFIPGAPLFDNLANWLRYGVLTSAGFDIPRAIMLAALLALMSQTMLTIIRRATRRASFTPVLAQE